MPNLILAGQTAGNDLNLIPFITLTPQDLTTSLLNILLLIPFGFGLPLITDLRLMKTVILGVLFSVLVELLQLGTGRLAGMTFRVADINDVIFNVVGACIGYALFLGFAGAFLRAYRSGSHPANPILRYIAGRPQVGRQSPPANR